MTPTSFAVVSAIYNVGRYLDDFFASLDRQSLGPNRLHVVLVIDGATDDSLERCEAWKAETNLRVTIITKENGGQASARNRGLEAVEEDWVTFIDPDDFVSEGYFSEVAEQLNVHLNAVMAVTHLKDFREENGEIRDSHPLRYRFKGGNQLVDLDRFPGHTHMSASSAFFRTGLITSSALRFDELLRPVFEDAHFVQRYLLYSPEPMVLFVDTAEYYYRRRSDYTSTLQNAASDPNKYTTVVERGLLSLLREAVGIGEVPRWLQYAVIYELTWTFRAEESLAPQTAGVDGKTAARFHELVSEVRSYLEDAAIDEFPMIKRSLAQVEILKYGYSQTPWHWRQVYIARYIKERNLVQLCYRYTGDQPKETILFRGQEVQPYASKTRVIPFLRSRRLHERMIWMPANGTIAIQLNGVTVPLTFKPPEQEKYSVRPAEMAKKDYRRDLIACKEGVAPKRSVGDRSIEVLADSKPIAKMFKDAWVLMDRVDAANDNAEHLFRYLRSSRRDINAWFVLDRKSPDWRRLKNAGYKRLIPYGSPLWKALCVNASFLISSHIDEFVINPFVLAGGRRPEWRYVFLQHGVSEKDISNWLNHKTIDLMIAVSFNEFAALCGDGSNYKLSPAEVKLTGFPRYDRLRRLAAEAGSARRFITIMPTWRKGLTVGAQQRDGKRSNVSDILDSEFAKRWIEVVNSPELHALAEAHGLTVNFMPHPNLYSLLPDISVPEHVKISTYKHDNVQDVLVSSAAIVTDYSSVAFDAALADAAVIYYQFDREQVFSGKHLARAGFFSYYSHGFGPVVDDLDSLVADLRVQLDKFSPQRQTFDRRKQKFFADMPENACRAVVDEVLNLSKPIKPKQAFVEPLETPEAPPIQYFN